MPEVSVKSNKISSSIASNHVKVSKPNEPQCVAGYKDGQYYSGFWSGGVCYGLEIPPSSPYDYQNINATIEGTISEGASNVFVNGKQLARKGDPVRTHANSTASIQEGSTNVFAN